MWDFLVGRFVQYSLQTAYYLVSCELHVKFWIEVLAIAQMVAQFCSRIITQSDTNGDIHLHIFVTNSSGYAARVTQDDLAISNIIIDTIPPTITLNGNSEDHRIWLYIYRSRCQYC